MCCGPTASREAACFACRWVGRRLGGPLAPVFPVRLCPLPSPLYTVLLGYKESPVSEARARFGPMVRRIAAGFARGHAACLASAAGGPFDLVCAVPSSARPSGSPLEAVEGLGRAVGDLTDAQWLPGLLGRGSAPVSHMRPHPGAYTLSRVAPELRGRRVLLLDDTYVSGARAQSAAAGMRARGADAVVVMALGRVLRPDRSPRHAAFLRRHSRPADPGNGLPAPCCRCRQTAAPTE